MPSTKPPARLAWEDRFSRPTLTELKGHYNKQLAGLYESARAKLLEFDGAEEELVWMGLPWRWTLRYRLEGAPPEAWAYVVPDPLGVEVTIPLTTEMIDAMPTKRLKKHVRDGITFGKRVGEVTWASWQPATKGPLDEVLDVAKRKYKFLAEVRAESARA